MSAPAKRRRVYPSHHDKDWSGIKFGDWTVLGPAERDGWSWALRCQCTCGAIHAVRGSKLLGGYSLGCAACMGPKRMAAKLGRVYGKWTVLRIADPKGFICRCECGRERRVTAGNIYSQSSRGCAECRYAAMDNGFLAAWWCSVNSGARSRGIKVKITREEALALLEQQENKCKLSGVPIKMVRSRKNYYKDKATASLDRIDSKGDYTLDNVQWVHKHINYMKQSYSQEHFIEMCRLVAEHNKHISNNGEQKGYYGHAIVSARGE